MAKIVILDGHNFIYRSFHGNKPKQTIDGISTNALYGCLRTLKIIVNKFNMDYIICCWDNGSKTFRNEIDENYKAHRNPAPQELKQQFSITQEGFSHLGVSQIIAPEGVEGDDTIASLAVIFGEAGHDVIVVSADKDFHQIVSKNVNLVSFNDLNIVVDESYIFLKYGLKSEQLIDVKALQGDVADNIPGIRGIGPKTAISLIREHKNIHNLLKHLEENPTHKYYHIFEEKELALKCLSLATINTKVKIDPPTILPVNKIEVNDKNLKEFFQKYELEEMQNNFNMWYYLFNYKTSLMV